MLKLTIVQIDALESKISRGDTLKMKCLNTQTDRLAPPYYIFGRINLF